MGNMRALKNPLNKENTLSKHNIDIITCSKYGLCDILIDININLHVMMKGEKGNK